MPEYRPNVTDKQQGDIETAVDDSAIRFTSFDVATGDGEMKSIPAYDLQSQDDAGGSPNDAIQLGVTARNPIIGSHNDKPHRFENPGKA